MREDLEDVVHRIVHQGLRLRERLAQKEPADFDTEQALLKGLLGQIGPDLRRAEPGSGGLDVRYALVCWLDETMILHSPWGVKWKEKRLEWALYNTAVGGDRFVELAERATGDALEVFFLCVMLGFRGRWSEEPDRLRSWVEAARAQIIRGKRRECPLVPPALDPPANVPPLRGREKLRQLTPAWVVVLSLLVLVVMLLAVRFVVS
jgi:type IV/VI secretion system ImpK/VasF family protein